MKIGKYDINPLMFMLVFIPVFITAELIHANPVLIFIFSGMSIIPLAGLMGEATEHLSEKTGPGTSGFLNATFGNAAELIIALMALQKGLHEVVKASITGSIIGNVLLVLGLSIFTGGIKYEKQTFNRTASSLGSTLLALSTIALVVPAIFDFVVGESGKVYERELSLDIAIVLAAVYVLSLFFSLKTHKHLYSHARENHEPVSHNHGWSMKKSVSVLVGATVGVAIMGEFLVGAVEHTAKAFNMTDVFVGVILVALIGNAAEHSTAIIVASKNKMDLAINVAVGSSIQIALFVAPLLVFISYAFGKPMDLLFTPFEVVSVGLAVWVVNMVTSDGESHWMEGVLLLAVYVILGMVFYFLP